MKGSWYRMNADELNDDLVAATTAAQGPLGPASWMFALGKAKRENRAGLVELSPVVMGRECGVTSEQAAKAISTLVLVGLVQMTEEEGAYLIPDWSERQPDARPAGRERPRDTPGQPGSPRLQDTTGQDQRKTHSAGARAPRRGGAQAQRRAASEARQAIIASEAELQDLSGEPDV